MTNKQFADGLRALAGIYDNNERIPRPMTMVVSCKDESTFHEVIRTFGYGSIRKTSGYERALVFSPDFPINLEFWVDNNGDTFSGETLVKHTHKYLRVINKPGHGTYKRVVPGHTHYQRRELLIGNIPQCWVCGEDLVLNKESLTRKKPIHSLRRRTRGQDEIE